MKLLGARRAKSNPRRYPHTYIQKLASAYRSVHRVRSTTGALHLFFSLSPISSPPYMRLLQPSTVCACSRARVRPVPARVCIYLGARAHLPLQSLCFSLFLVFKGWPERESLPASSSPCVCVCNGARARAFVYSFDGFEGERERESWRRFSGV